MALHAPSPVGVRPAERHGLQRAKNVVCPTFGAAAAPATAPAANVSTGTDEWAAF